MFIVAALILIVFSLIFGLFSAAIFYHLYQYTLPGHPSPRIITGIFIALSVLFWLLALFFLFKIPH